jgi:hypothetical protein
MSLTARWDPALLGYRSSRANVAAAAFSFDVLSLIDFEFCMAGARFEAGLPDS